MPNIAPNPNLVAQPRHASYAHMSIMFNPYFAYGNMTMPPLPWNMHLEKS